MKKLVVSVIIIMFYAICSASEFHDFRGTTDANGNIKLYFRDRVYIYAYPHRYLNADLFVLNVSTMNVAALIESQSDMVGQSEDTSGNVFHDYILNDESGYSTINCGVDFSTGAWTKSFIRLEFMEYLYWDENWEPAKYFANIKRSNIFSPIIYTTYYYDGINYLIKSNDGGTNWTSVENAPNYTVRGVSPFNDQLVFCASSEGNLFRSENGTTTTVMVDDTSYLNWDIYRLPPGYSHYLHWFTSHLPFLFDVDEQHIYAIVNTNYIVRSEDNGFIWEVIANENSPIFIDIDINNSGVLFKSVGTDIFKSTDYGDTFTLFQTLPDNIGGIYLVDNTDTLYAVTHNSLYEVTDTGIELLILLPTDSDENTIPKNSFELNNHPNPFNPSTTISFSIPEESNVELTIFNIKGQKVKTLAQNEFNKGSHSIIWNGINENGEAVSSGVYLYKLNVNGKTEAMKKCLLLK